MPTKLNHLSGKEWLQYSFSIWRDIKKNPDEKLKHPAIFPADLASKIIDIFTCENDVVIDPFLVIGLQSPICLTC